MGVSERTRPTSSDSGFGFVKKLTMTVTMKLDGEGEDGAPEVLRHVAGIVMDYGDPAAVDAGVRFDGQREAVMEARRRAVPVIRPVNAAWPVVRFQNMPSRNVAKSGAFTKLKTSWSVSMMLLKLMAA